MYDVNKLLPIDQFEEVLRLLPTPRQKKRGRKRSSKRAMVTGIFQVLVLGIPWRQMFDCGCSYSSCYRYFKELQRRNIFKLRFKQLADGKTNLEECAIDTDSTRSFRFKCSVGWSGKHKKNATKISLLTDKKGLPADVLFGKGDKHDRYFVDDHIKNTSGRRKKILNLDRIYVSAEMRRRLRRKGIFVNMKTRKNDYIRKIGPKFKLKTDKYKIRFLIEKTFAWIDNFKRCKYRIEYSLSSFKAFVYLALLVILIRN